MKKILLILLLVPLFVKAQWVDPNNDGTGSIHYSNGNVGIGTSTPDSKLTIKGNVNIGEEGNYHLKVRHIDGKHHQNASIDNLFLNYNTSKPVYIGYGGQNSNLLVSGNLGIGTTSPQTLLDLEISATGNQYGKGISLRRGSGYLKFRNGTGTGFFSPNITGKATTNWASAGIYIKGIPASDQVGYVGISISAGESAPLVNADVLKIKNYSTDLIIVKSSGNVGIGTTAPTEQLHVQNTIRAGVFRFNSNGHIIDDARYDNYILSWAWDGNYGDHTKINWGGNGAGTDLIISQAKGLIWDGNFTTEEVRVEVIGADFVFAPDYNLMPLTEIEAYVKQNHHLPEVPSAAEMKANGVELGKMNMLLLQKIEELTLLMIELKKEKDSELALLKIEIGLLKNN